MTLHDAITLVISSTKRPLTRIEIANEVNKKHLYIKGDASLVKPSQIVARLNKYPHLFHKDHSTRPCKILLVKNEH